AQAVRGQIARDAVILEAPDPTEARDDRGQRIVARAGLADVLDRDREAVPRARPLMGVADPDREVEGPLSRRIEADRPRRVECARELVGWSVDDLIDVRAERAAPGVIGLPDLFGEAVRIGRGDRR